jgi:hypothetical protein
MTNLCPSKLESTMAEHLSLLTVTLSTDEKLGRDRHRCRSQVPDGRNQIVPEISTPRFELMSTTGVMPSEVRPAGMQGIASFFGAELYNQREVKHGVSEKVIITNDSLLLKDVPAVFDVGLYHSWAVKLNERLPLTEIAHSEHGVTMALKHQTLPIYGVQFHPESILTPEGKKIVSNFIFNC